MTRPDRLAALVLALQATAWQRAADLAEALDVSSRTIYRDVRALREAGVPIVAGPGRGYRIAEGYVLPPLLFATDEAVMLLLGSRIMADNHDEHFQQAARRAAMKVERVLPESVRGEVERLHESLRFVPVNAFDNPEEAARLRVVRRALVAQRALRFTEAGSQGAERRLHPYGLLHRGSAWYVLGEDPAASAVRSFRLDRMDDLAVLDEPFERPPGYRTPPEDAVRQRPLTVRVAFSADVARWVREAPSPFTVAMEETAEGLLVTLRVRREAELIPWLLSWGAHARVLEPPSLQARLRREAERMAAQYAGALTLLP